jgi:carbon starvation protein
MNIGLLLVSSLILLWVGYRFYGRYVAKVFGIDSANVTPATRINDGVDYVPANKVVLFGHHYASIAAAGPIVGPTLALLYGIGPTWLWIILGVIFIGAVHDFSVLIVSVREGGKSIAQVARKTLGKNGFTFFIIFALLLSILVTAAFLQLAAVALTSTYALEGLDMPAGQTLFHTEVVGGETMVKLGGIASTSVVVITAFAPLMGFLLYRKRLHTGIMSLFALGLAGVSVVVGLTFPISLDPQTWMVILSIYLIIAAAIPVWLLLQPRDFVNVNFLYIGLFGMFLAILINGLNGSVIDAPMFNLTGESFSALGAVWPFLFVTIACGACSGAHSLIASGTTSKQLADEQHAVPVGYGGMLMEAVLGILVTLTIMGGLGFSEYSAIVWPVAEDGHLLVGNAPLAFALGVGKTVQMAFGVPTIYGTVFGILVLEGFVITTIDTIIRLERYLFEELWASLFETVPAFLRVKYVNSGLAVLCMVVLAFSNAYQTIWPIFGSANQLLAALSLIAVSAWLVQKSRNAWITAIPAIFMVATTLVSLFFLLERYFTGQNWTLFFTDILMIGLALGVVVMTWRSFYKLRKGLANG